MDQSSGYLLGLFPVNILHNIVHILVGVWGMAAASSKSHARLYGRTFTVVFALLTVMGLIPGLDTTFGLIPLFGHDVWSHALTTLVAAYIGWSAPLDERRARAAVRQERTIYPSFSARMPRRSRPEPNPLPAPGGSVSGQGVGRRNAADRAGRARSPSARPVSPRSRLT